MGGVHPGRVGQRHQLVVQRVVELAGQLVAGEADRRQQVGSADVADEQGVAGQHAVGDRRRRRARRPRCSSTQVCARACGGTPASRRPANALAVGDAHRPRTRSRRPTSRRSWRRSPSPARGGPDRKSAWKWVSMTSSIVRPASSASATYSLTSRCGSTTTARPGGFVADQIRRVRETVQVVLVELHGVLLLAGGR